MKKIQTNSNTKITVSRCCKPKKIWESYIINLENLKRKEKLINYKLVIVVEELEKTYHRGRRKTYKWNGNGDEWLCRKPSNWRIMVETNKVENDYGKISW